MTLPAFRGILITMLAATLCAAPGCNTRLGGSKGLDKVADELRAENSELREKLRAAEDERDELKAKLADRRAEGALPSQGDEIARATPHLAGIEIDSLSGMARDGRWTVYVRPYDGRRRFLQAVGTLEVAVKGPGGEVLAGKRLTPLELRDAYRSSFAGTHYEVELSAEQGAAGADPAKNFRIEAVLIDAGGTRFQASREVLGTGVGADASKPE